MAGLISTLVSEVTHIRPLEGNIGRVITAGISSCEPWTSTSPKT